MKKGFRWFIIFALVITALLYLANSMYDIDVDADGQKTIVKVEKQTDLDLTQWLTIYQSGTFEKVTVINDTILEGYQKIDKESDIPLMSLQSDVKVVYYNLITSQKPMMTELKDLGISLTGATAITASSEDQNVLSKLFLESILPLLFFLVAAILLFRFMGPKWGGMPFKIQAGKLKTKKEITTRFTDVAGMEETKEELVEIVEFLKNPTKFSKAGARVPKGVLLFGQPGSGKTLLARAVAGEANVPFFSASGSEFMEMLVGMGAAKVRELFNKAKAASPAIIFIDEIDAIGKRRGSWFTGGHQEQEQTLNQILTEMDGFDKETRVIVIAATNRPDTLDPALLRSGRFDRKVMVWRPTLEERVLIIKYHLQNKKLDKSADIESLARKTSGFVGADIETILNEAALKAAKENRVAITNKDLDYGLEKMVMWPEKKIKSLKEQEKKIVTYHELGHAVTAFNLPEADPVEKISIVSRGMALGVTWMLPVEDKYLTSKAKFLDELVGLLGGRAAEEIFFGKEHITTGASNDFERVTRIAIDMITKYGMDEELGNITYQQKEDGDYSMYKPYSEKTAELIDQKVKELVENAYTRAKAIILGNKEIIEKLADVLYEKEYLTKEEFELVMKDPENTEASVAKMLDEHREELKKVEGK